MRAARGRVRQPWMVLAREYCPGYTGANMLQLQDARIAVIGLGYVGLPLAVEFGRRYPTLGFDVNTARIRALEAGEDATGEVDAAALGAAGQLRFSADPEALKGCNVYIIAVPTPIDQNRQPNLRPLVAASETVAGAIGPGDVVIYESTVYPGATEEDCIPVIERLTGMRLNTDFFAGYSPERINPGDKARPVTKIVKVTSGSTPEAADLVDALYRSIIPAGTHKASSIKVAEASKIIENTQRDVNIALINELSVIFSHLGIDTADVLDAAATKWNFIRLAPGLVGGHCIGVDPYYLVHKSMAAGHVPDIIRIAREINDGMARDVAGRLVRAMVRRGIAVSGARVLILGVTFKENCPDIRNTKIVDLAAALEGWGAVPVIADPWADPAEVAAEYGRTLAPDPGAQAPYAAAILAVPHAGTVAAGPAALRALLEPGGVLFDMKSVFAPDDSDLRL